MPAFGLPRPGTTADTSQLDGPPPSPAVQTGQNPGTPLGALVPPIPSMQLPPEVLTGILQAGEQIITMFDSFAQVTPDLATDWAVAREATMAAMAKVLQAGAAPTSPTAPGPGFPGGGVDAGGMPSASGSV